MLEVDFDDLDLGSKRKPTEWVAVLPPSAQQPRQRSSRYVSPEQMFASELSWAAKSVHVLSLPGRSCLRSYACHMLPTGKC